MTPAMIPPYLDSRMKELGNCNGYAMRIKHYVIEAGQTITVKAFGEIYILLEQVSDMRIESDLGVFSITGNNEVAEQQHEHTGQIRIKNLSADSNCDVQFVQAIPLDNNPEACPPCNS